MSKTRRWAAAISAGLALSMTMSVLPAEAIVGTRGQHPIVGDRDAPSDYAEVSYPALPVVVSGGTTTVEPLGMTNPDGSEVADPAAAGYTFRTDWNPDDGWVGTFWQDMTIPNPDGSLTFTPEYNAVTGISEAGIIIDNPDLGTPEYQLIRHQVVPGSVADLVNPEMDAVHYRGFKAQQGFRDSVIPEIWSRETGDQLDAAPANYSFAFGAPDAERGWEVPEFLSINPDTGVITSAPGADEPDAEYQVPVVITDDNTGATTTAVARAEVGEVIYQGPFGSYSQGESSAEPLISNLSSQLPF